MMHKAWSSIKEVPYCFSRSSVNFQGHTGQKKIIDFGLNCTFPDCNSSLNSLMGMKWCSRLEELPYYFSMSSVKFKGHTGQKFADYDQNWAFPDRNSSLNLPMALEWCTKLDVVWKMCPSGFEVLHQISRSHETKTFLIWPELRVSGL